MRTATYHAVLSGRGGRMQRRRTRILAAEYPEIVKVVQSCGRDDFDAGEAANIAASLSPQYLGT